MKTSALQKFLLRLIQAIWRFLYKLFQYDCRDNQTSKTDGNGNVANYFYDGLNRLVRSDIALAANTATTRNAISGGFDNLITILQEWDVNSRLIAQTDDNGNRTTYTYDELNRRTQTTFADGTTNQYTFNHNSLVTIAFDANGSQTNYLYDSDNRLTQKNITPAPGVEGVTQQAFSWDGRSRMTSASDNSLAGGNVALEYNSLDMRITDNQNGRLVRTAYDGVGNARQTDYPAGKIVTRAYDELERITQINDQTGNIASYSYAGPYRVIERYYGNNTAKVNAYDGDRRITDVSHQRSDGTGAFADFSYIESGDTLLNYLTRL